MASGELTWGPNPSTIFNTHQSGLSQMTGMSRMPLAILGAMLTQASSVMKPVGVISMVEPGAAPYFFRKASSNPARRRVPGGKNAVGPVAPAAFPDRYTVIETRLSPFFFSCFFLSLPPTIFTVPSLARRQVSSPPTTKWSMTSPKVLPFSGPVGHTPVFFSRSSSRAASTV